MTEKRYFGTDGIRGRVGEEPITPQTMLRLGWAAGCVLGRGGRVLIGKDTRVSGYLLESALEAGLSAAGVDIGLIGPLPTPGIAYLTRASGADAGVVISASHNPFFDNGIKFFSRHGSKLASDVEVAIEQAMEGPMQIVESRKLGKAERLTDARERYIRFCTASVSDNMILDGMKVVLDCANGAAYQVAPQVLRELGMDVITLGCDPDGFNINQACGSTSPQALQRAVVENQAAVGIALDGDGDRVILSDGQGQLVDGDRILFIIARARQAAGRLQGGVVGTLMSNLGLEQACAGLGIPFRRAAVGDRYVMDLLAAEGWAVGGETSGHIICLDKASTGDGIIAALEVLCVMAGGGRSLADLAAGMAVFPQSLINVPLPNGRRVDVQADAQIRRAVQQAEQELAANGRVLLRPSGTEPVVRVMVEGRDAAQVKRISSALAEVVRRAALAG